MTTVAPAGIFCGKSTPRFHQVSVKPSASVGAYEPNKEVVKSTLARNTCAVFRSNSPRFSQAIPQHTAPLTYRVSSAAVARSQSVATASQSHFMASATPRIPTTKPEREINAYVDPIIAARNMTIMSRHKKMDSSQKFSGNVKGTVIHRTAPRFAIHEAGEKKVVPGPGAYEKPTSGTRVSESVPVPAHHVFASKVDRFAGRPKEGPSVGMYASVPIARSTTPNPNATFGGKTKRWYHE